jgi:superfamily II DNA or RNA helicase
VRSDVDRETDADALDATRGRLRLRAWQREALARFEDSPSPNFLAVATPGAGKTLFALGAVLRALLSGLARRVVIVVPTQHLKHQWAHAAERLDLHLDPEWSAGYGLLPSDVHGVVVTYQQVAANPGALRGLVPGALIVLDEVHHAGESRSWGDGVRFAFEPAVRRLCLSGTPFRSDQNVIPFVRYDGDLAHADYEYGYAEALRETAVVRPVYFPRIKGVMEWSAPDGDTYSATFDDRLTRELANQRLRTAFDVEGDWLPAVLAQANTQLRHLRQRDPRAAGLVIAIDQAHARGIAGILEERLGVTATVATSDDPAASARIARFVDSNDPWIVAVRMVSEGVDIPRLRLGVYATNTVTELFFRQAVGRLVRWTGTLAKQTAYMFIPDDVRLRTFAANIAEQRRHSLARREVDQLGPEEMGAFAEPPPGEAPEAAEPDDGQLSMFSAISAVPLDEHGRPLDEAGARVFGDETDAGEVIPDLVEAIDSGAANDGGPGSDPEPFMLAPSRAAPPLPPSQAIAALLARPQSALARRRELREQNSEIVRELTHMLSKTHAEVNGLLNRQAGIRRISEATVRQLERRLELARKLMRR